MKMENENISGEEILESIRETRRTFHNKARFPNAVLIHPQYYILLKGVMDQKNLGNSKKIFDLIIYETEDISSYELIRVYDSHECSI